MGIRAAVNLETSFAKALAATDARRIDLAHCQPFQIGSIAVVPATCSLRGPGELAIAIQPLAMRVLIALAAAGEETCSRDDLVEACWSQRIVGDDAIHRVISTLRGNLAKVSGGAVAIETIPKVGYRLQIAPPANRVEAVHQTPPLALTRQPRRWRAALLLVTGLVGAAFLATDGVSADVTAIAVVGEGGAAAGESARFVDSLTGDLARLASAMPSLSFVEAGGASVREPLLLRVAVDTDNPTPTARVRLVDGKGGAVVWSREFSAEGGTLAELRERVANGVTGVVQCGLDRSATFDDPVGLRLYLGACEGLETGDFERARTFAQQITEVRPDSPAGWACLANSTIFAEANEGSIDEAVIARAETYARKALAVDPKSGLAHAALAMATSWRGEPVLAILESGIRADPDFAMLHKHYAWALSAAGMTSRAVDPALRAVALHPHNPGHYQIAVATLLNAGRTGEAVALTEKMHRLWRYDRGVEMQRLDMLFYAPDPQAALAAANASPRKDDISAGPILEALAWRADSKAYDWTDFDRAARETYAADKVFAWDISVTAARMGDEERAFQWLARAPSDAFTAWIPLFGPEAAALRRDPRFFDKMVEAGMVARWRKSGRWPDFCADPGLKYDCRERARTLRREIAARAAPGESSRARS